MQKYTTYIFPLVVFSVIFLLIYRWHNLQQQELEGNLFAEGVQIENLSEEELANSLNGVGDYKTIELQANDEDAKGVVRYELADEKVRFSVVANLPEIDDGYRVWLKEVNGDAMREVFSLELGKGGYIGSAVLPQELLPFEVVVTTKDNPLEVLDNSLLQGVVEVQEVEK